VNRHTFVVQIYPDGVSVVENLGTQERVRIADLAAVGPQIERWLVDLSESRSGVAAPRGMEEPRQS
jgi:hypothetical protein